VEIAGQVVLITGAASGIGRALARGFAADGALVAGFDRNQARLVETAQGCAGEMLSIEGDVALTADVERMTKGCIDRYGRIDVLFNNAGIVTNGTADTTSEEVWSDTIAINITAVWHMCKLVIPQMKKQGGGVIVNNGSDWSVVAGKNAFPYIMSKGAVGMMTKAMALDHARENIRVNAVCPGDTLVDRWLESGYFEGSDPVTMEEAIKESSEYLPMGRFGQPEEIAKAALFLASADSSFVTGHLLLVDGGNTAQ